MWEPQPITTLRASKACRGENFTFFYLYLLPVFMSWFFPAFSWRDKNVYLVFSVFPMLMENWRLCHLSRLSYYKSSQYCPLWILPHQCRMVATNCFQCIFREAVGRTPPLAWWMVSRSEGLHLPVVVWVKWLYTDTFSICNFLDSGSGVFFYSSQYTNFLKTCPCLRRHDYRMYINWDFFCFKWVIFLGVMGSWRIRLTASPPSVSWLSRKCGSLHGLLQG
jgi:hypothetical protein